MTTVTAGVLAAVPDQTYASAAGVATSVPVPRVLVPDSGATVSGTTAFDASAPDASSVDFLLFGGSYGLAGRTICAATKTVIGRMCEWSTTRVPSGSYTLVSGAATASGSALSTGVRITVTNGNVSTATAPRSVATAGAPPTSVPFSVPVPDDEFSTGSLNTSLWSPDWFGSGQESNDTVMSSSNVTVDANGLELLLDADGIGGLLGPLRSPATSRM